MARLRTLFLVRPWLALALVVAALAVRLIVPAGMMPSAGGLVVCPGTMAVPAAMPGMTMPGDRHDADGHAPGRHDAGHDPSPCAYTSLLAAALDAVAAPGLPPPPTVAIVGLLGVLLAVAVRRVRLRPPLRGPPPAIA